MKKILLLTLPFLLLNVSCEKEEEHEMLFSYFQEKLDTLVYVDSSELMTLHNNEEDFILFLFSDCGCSDQNDNALATIKSYVNKTHRLIYTIANSDYQKLEIKYQDTFPIYPSDSYEELHTIPALFFYKHGQLIKKQYYDDFMLKVDSLGDFINKYANENGVNLINDVTPYSYKGYYFVKFKEETTTLLNDKIKGHNTIYYSWKECLDCFSFKNILCDYYKENNLKLYMYEVHHFRNSENKETLWDDEENGFPYKYQFASYRGGKVPALVTYDNSKKENMLIYHNDVIENGVITESFFSELIGKTLSEEEREEFHKNKVLEYLNAIRER